MTNPDHVKNTYSVKVNRGCFTPEDQLDQDTLLVVKEIEALAKGQGCDSVKVDVIAADLGLLVVKCPEEFVPKLKQLPGIEYVEPVPMRRPMSPPRKPGM